jgi:hypothetical protein
MLRSNEHNVRMNLRAMGHSSLFDYNSRIAREVSGNGKRQKVRNASWVGCSTMSDV